MHLVESVNFMNIADEIHELNYDLIKHAVHGDQKALEEVLRIYDRYINSLVTYETVGPNGQVLRQIDEDMKIQVQMKLVDAIQTKWREII